MGGSMYYPETKVYFDGSHYIAIPHTTRKTRPRREQIEEEITVVEDEIDEVEEYEEIESNEKETDTSTLKDVEEKTKTPKITITTKKEYFNQLYQESWNMTKAKRCKYIENKMLAYFDTEEECTKFVDDNIERKLRNLIARRIRMSRKSNLTPFDYFCTFTYDDKKHNEDSFRKGLKTCFRNFCNRKGWKYMGVWERSPENNRLHFHGLFYIPEGTLPGEMIEVNDYDLKAKRRQITHQNTYFNNRFGRSDFKQIEGNDELANARIYLTKYIEKTGEKIVYSKGIPQYFISDIIDDDVVCKIGMEDKKLLLYDDFECWNEGESVGQVGQAAIRQLRKAN